MSYPALLHSLATTPRDSGDTWRLVAGTLLRQAFNTNHPLTRSRFVADLRSVGWGGRRQDVARAFDVMYGEVFQLSVSRQSQNNTDLESFNRVPPRAWRKDERANADRFVSHCTVVVQRQLGAGAEGRFTLVRLWGANTKKLPTVIQALSYVRDSYDQGEAYVRHEVEVGELDSADVERYREDVITYEYAGVRHLRRT